jgi:alginate O-acetyltransferase complex protein AlgI
VLGEKADLFFSAETTDLSLMSAWIGVIAYSFQIYFDFSGYSDMAIGLGRMTGFKFPENFNNPYISNNITEFWRRWHITLGRFMRDYLYIPLGGNRVKTTSRLYFNLWIVFLISGLWHGAAWNFVIWGAFHGLFLILDRLFLIRLTKKIGNIPSIILTYFITLIGWVLFRADTIIHAGQYIQAMFSFEKIRNAVVLDNEFWFMMSIGFVFSFITITRFGQKMEKLFFYKQEYTTKQYVALTLLGLFLLLVAAGAITSSGFNPFIYYRF